MQLPHVFMHFLVQFMLFPHGNIAFSLCIFRGPICAPRWPDMQLPFVFIAFFMRDQAFPHVFIAVWHPLGFLLVLLGLLFGMLGGLCGASWASFGAKMEP